MSRLDVRYREGEPAKITSARHGQEAQYVFAIEGQTARLVDVRAKHNIDAETSALDVLELNQVHDAVLGLPFIDRVTVWMKGRTDTATEKPTAELGAVEDSDDE